MKKKSLDLSSELCHIITENCLHGDCLWLKLRYESDFMQNVLRFMGNYEGALLLANCSKNCIVKEIYLNSSLQQITSDNVVGSH